MRNIFLFLLTISLTIPAFAQNLVVNGSFEEIEKKPKNPGEVYLAPPWVAGTKAVPDLYSKKAKDDKIKVPNNNYGDEEPKDGENYAGILLYSDREKEPRSYLSQKLKYPMLAGEWYCVKFHVSFADLSKYAVDNLGCYISKDSIGSETDLILNYQPQVQNSTNRIFEKQWDWEDICRIYVAEGGEQYITIGNFAKQDDVKKKSIKRPRGYTSSQFRDGYYFIDDISVVANATRENCKCEPGNFQFAHLDKEEAEFSTADTDIPDKVIISTTGQVHGEMPVEKAVHEDVIVQFSKIKYNLSAAESKKLDEVAAFLNEKDDVKVTLIGHQDDSEKVVQGLSENRLSQVAKYLSSKGVSDDRIESEDAKHTKPVDASDEEANMSVELKFSKK